MNNDNSWDSTFVTSQRNTDRLWGGSTFNPTPISLPQPSDMISPSENLQSNPLMDIPPPLEEPIIDDTYYPDQTVIPSRHCLFSILANNIYQNCLLEIDKFNHSISPGTLYLLLLSLLIGSQQETFQELANLMKISKYDIIPSLVHDGINVYKDISKDIKIINGFFISQEYPIIPQYQNFFKKIGYITNINFASKNSSYQTINNWIRDQSRGKLDSFLNISHLSDSTQSIIISSLIIPIQWQIGFHSHITQMKPFRQSTGIEMNIPLMYQEACHMYVEDNQYQFVSSPLDNPNYVMDFILPRPKNNNFPVTKINQFIETYQTHQKPTDVKVIIPKMTHKVTNSFNWSLQKLFNPRNTNLNNISLGMLSMSNILVQNLIEVTENGLGLTPIKTNPSTPMFLGNRTFQYTLRYLPTNVLLLVGVFDGN